MRVLALSLLALSLPAAAQQDPSSVVDEDALVPEFIIKAVTELDFDGTRVSAQLVGPDGKLISEPPARHHRQLITVRANFDDEMDRSVAQVK